VGGRQRVLRFGHGYVKTIYRDQGKKLDHAYPLHTLGREFFKTLKYELAWRTVFYSRSEAEHTIARYIDGFYNHVRRHSALDFISPAQFERLAAN
jgi:transposase InsO family protein